MPSREALEKNKTIYRTEYRGKIYDVKADKVKDFVNKEFWSAYKMYYYMNKLGCPNGIGWGNEPSLVLTIWNLFDQERIRLENQSAEKLKRRANGGVNGNRNQCFSKRKGR